MSDMDEMLKPFLVDLAHATTTAFLYHGYRISISLTSTLNPSWFNLFLM